MEITHLQKNIHTSPRKLRLVADVVRKMTPAQSLVTLQFTQQVAAVPLAKAIQTAVANARVKNMDEVKLTFKALEINEGFVMKRMRPAGRSHRRPYQRRTSQVRIVLTDEVTSQNLKVKVGRKEQSPTVGA